MTFQEGLAEAKVEASTSTTDTKQIPSDPAILNLVEKHPKLAIIEAWQRIEGAMIKLFEMYDEKKIPSFRWADWANQKQIISGDQRRLLNHLRELRNVAVHSTGQELTSDDAYNYIELAEAIERHLNHRLSSGTGYAD